MLLKTVGGRKLSRSVVSERLPCSLLGFTNALTDVSLADHLSRSVFEGLAAVIVHFGSVSVKLILMPP